MPNLTQFVVYFFPGVIGFVSRENFASKLNESLKERGGETNSLQRQG